MQSEHSHSQLNCLQACINRFVDLRMDFHSDTSSYLASPYHHDFGSDGLGYDFHPFNLHIHFHNHIYLHSPTKTCPWISGGLAHCNMNEDFSEGVGGDIKGFLIPGDMAHQISRHGATTRISAEFSRPRNRYGTSNELESTAPRPQTE